MTTWMDAAVGRMLAALDRTGLAEDTVVVFTSDHGDNLGSLGLWQKGGPNEESTRIPLLWRYPAAWPGGQVAAESVASLVDVAPTLIELAGGTPPDCMAGQSLAPMLRDPTVAPPRTHAFTEGGDGIAVRTRTHMCFVPRDAEAGTVAATATQFFDLTADPYELSNLAGTPEQSSVREALEDEIRACNQQTPWLPAREGETHG